MGLTADRHDGCLHELDPDGSGMYKCYLILPDGQRKNLVRPLFRAYIHHTCGTVTRMGLELCETYSAKPSFYSRTFCAGCKTHLPVGEHGEFTWIDAKGDDTGIKVGT